MCQPVSVSLLPSLLPSFLPFLSPSLDLSLHQGNLRFSKGEEDELVIENGEQLKVIASLLGSTPEMSEKALCYRVVGNKLGAVEKEHTLEQALYGRDALAKVCVGGGGGENGVCVCGVTGLVCGAASFPGSCMGRAWERG